MSRFSWCFAIPFLLCTTSLLPAQTGKLQSARDAMSQSSSSDSKSGKSDSGSDDDDNPFMELITRAVFDVAVAPFVLPPHFLGDDYDVTGYFQSYPYQDGLPGYLRMDRFSDPKETPEGYIPCYRSRLKPWSVRLSAEEGNDFDGLNRIGAHVFVDTATRFGVQSNWNYFQENLAGNRHDRALLGDTNLTFRFAQNEVIEMCAGIGFRVWDDDSTSKWGFNFTYGGDIYLEKPFVLSGSIDIGNAGSAAVFHARASAGALFHGCEFYGGYDFIRIGTVNLQGPMVGMRFWF